MTLPHPLDPPPSMAAELPAWELDFLVRRTQSLLAAQVPLTLLLDLASAAGPDSTALYAAEPADVSWLTPRAG